MVSTSSKYRSNFPQIDDWTVAPLRDVQIREGYLSGRLDEDREPVDPVDCYLNPRNDEESAHTMFANLQVDDEHAKKFFSTWGPLKFGDENRKRNDLLSFRLADFWERQARFRALVHLVSALKSPKARQRLKTFFGEPNPISDEAPVQTGARLKLLEMLFPTLESIESRQVAVNRSKPADLRRNASLVLAVAVNEYLVQVPTLLLPNLRNGFPLDQRLSWDFLEQALGVILSLECSSDRPLLECERCHRFFSNTRAKRFCSDKCNLQAVQKRYWHRRGKARRKERLRLEKELHGGG